MRTRETRGPHPPHEARLEPLALAEGSALRRSPQSNRRPTAVPQEAVGTRRGPARSPRRCASNNRCLAGLDAPSQAPEAPASVRPLAYPTCSHVPLRDGRLTGQPKGPNCSTHHLVLSTCCSRWVLEEALLVRFPQKTIHSTPFKPTPRKEMRPEPLCVVMRRRSLRWALQNL